MQRSPLQPFPLRAAIALAAAGVWLASCASGASSYGYHRPHIEWNDTRWCAPLRLKIALRKISRRYGDVTVHSSFRWPIENWRKGGATKSYHLSCRAVDFQVSDDSPEVLGYIRSLREVGGYSRYDGHYHIDTGPRRTW